MALDESRDTDEKTVQDGVTYLIDQDLSKIVEGVSVDFVDAGGRQGFSITPKKPLTNDSACGGDCSC